jgi:hypothetical protein
VVIRGLLTMVELGEWVLKVYSWGLTALDFILLCFGGSCSRERLKVIYTHLDSWCIKI